MRLSLGPQALASALALLLAIPIVALVLAPGDLTAGLGDPLVGPAFGLSLRTSTLSLALILLCGTPLAWQLSRRPPGLLDTLVQLPIVIPPAVLGVALLLAFGRQGLLPTPIAFTSWAVVIAQVLVAAPFYVQAASAAFREVDPDHILVAAIITLPEQAIEYQDMLINLYKPRDNELVRQMRLEAWGMSPDEDKVFDDEAFDDEVVDDEVVDDGEEIPF